MTSTVKINCLWCPSSGGVCVGGGRSILIELTGSGIGISLHAWSSSHKSSQFSCGCSIFATAEFLNAAEHYIQLRVQL